MEYSEIKNLVIANTGIYEVLHTVLSTLLNLHSNTMG